MSAANPAATASQPKVDPRFLTESGWQIFDGNELLVKGALEAEGGVHLLSGYPGSPVATFFDVISNIAPLLKKHGIYAHQASNEAISAAMLNGSQMHGLRGMIAMKSVGVHVASDALALGNLAGAHPEGGAIVVLGDDPWSDSTQVPSDSRYLSEHLRMPVLEAADVQELKDWVDVAFKLSRLANLYIGYMITPILADGGGTVRCYPNRYPLTSTRFPVTLETAAFKLDQTVLLPPRTQAREADIPTRFDKLHQLARQFGLDRLEHAETASPAQPADYAFIACGQTYQFLRQAMAELGLWGRYPVLKLALTYPVDPESIRSIAPLCRNLVIVEERRGFVEQQVASLLILEQQAAKPTPRLWGKKFPPAAPSAPPRDGFPIVKGLNTGVILERLDQLFNPTNPASPGTRPANTTNAPEPALTSALSVPLQILHNTAKVQANLPARTPTFCPGCPHRDSSSVLLEMKKRFMDPVYMKRKHGRGPVDVVFHGDTGCYTMLMFAPNEPLMHNYSGMGLGGATGAGIDPFITNKQVVFMGDGTFFHSGMVAISNAIKAGQDITFIILDNATTAMTGHQGHPGTEESVLNDSTFRQDIERVVAGLGQMPGAEAGMHLRLARINPEDRKQYEPLLEQTILQDGVKVLIADKECGITFHRRNRRDERAQIKHLGYLPKKTYMNITEEVCENCRECTKQTGCPALTVIDTDHGPKLQTDLTTCVNDGACARIDACPSFEQVTVLRKRPQRQRGQEIKFDNLPEPAFVHPPFSKDPTATPWRAWLSGVGGMGIGMSSAILVRAGHLAGYHVRFADKKGLAIRNGGVFSAVTYAPRAADELPGFVSQSIPYGQADLLLGVDALEAARAIDPRMPYRVAHPERTSMVINTGKTYTVEALMNREGKDFQTAGVEQLLRSRCRPDHYFSHNITEQCERLFGTKLYGNIAALGVAFQLGLIPLTSQQLERAIHDTVPSDHKNNLRAFNLGRKLIVSPNLFQPKLNPLNRRRDSLAQLVREKAMYLSLPGFWADRRLRKLQRRRPGSRQLVPDSKLARQFKILVFTTLRFCRELDKQTKYDIAVRIYDLIQFDGIELARKYCEAIRLVFNADDPQHHFAITRSVVWNLAKLMIIKDEIYVAHLLTSYEKLRRDRQRFNVNPQNGDRIRYSRTFHPRYFGVKFTINAPNWSLYILRNLKFVRALLPGWHRSDKQFLAWYRNMLERFWANPHSEPAEYARWLAALACVDPVNGYREYREPKMDAARRRAEQILAGQASIPAPAIAPAR